MPRETRKRIFKAISPEGEVVNIEVRVPKIIPKPKPKIRVPSQITATISEKTPSLKEDTSITPKEKIREGLLSLGFTKIFAILIQAGVFIFLVLAVWKWLIPWLETKPDFSQAGWIIYFIVLGTWYSFVNIYLFLWLVVEKHRVFGDLAPDTRDFTKFLLKSIVLGPISGIIFLQIARWLTLVMPVSIVIVFVTFLVFLFLLIFFKVVDGDFDREVISVWVIIISVFILIVHWGIHSCSNSSSLKQTEKPSHQGLISRQTVQLNKPRGAKAEIIVASSRWSYGGNDFEFYPKETAGVGAVLDQAELKIWKMENRSESPSVFKKREPLSWKFKIAPIDISPYYSCSVFQCKSYISLKKYRNWLQEMEWIELMLSGKDEFGNLVSIVLEGFDDH